MNYFKRYSHRLIGIVILCLICSCSATKFVPDGQSLLSKVEVASDSSNFDASVLRPYVRQKANSKWFSLFKIPLATYSLAGRDSTKWINRTLKRIGEPPVIFDSIMAQQTCHDLTTAMQNRGFMQSSTDVTLKKNGKKLKATYILHPGIPYKIDDIRYDIQDKNISNLLEDAEEEEENKPLLKEGEQFSVDLLEAERKRITTLLTNHGYYRFNKDFIRYSADSASSDRTIDLTVHLMPYRINDELTDHPVYTVRKVNYLSGDDGTIHLRRNVLKNNTAIQPGKLFSSSDLEKTYNNFARLQAVKYTNIKFTEDPNSRLLDCDIQISTNKPSTISFSPEGTNTAGDLGAAATLTYQNRNLFHGSEVLSLQLRGAFEAITGLEGYQNKNYKEYSAEGKIMFPRFIVPFLSRSYRMRNRATSELSLVYNLQNRPEFHRRVFTLTWRYRWNAPQQRVSYRFDMVDLNYIYMPWISGTFKHDYLDSVSNRNAILKYNYSDLFIMKTGFGINYNNRYNAFRANVETAGNLLMAASHVFGFKENENDQFTMFNIAYAQYVKFDFDYTRLIVFDTRNQLAIHAAFGFAYPYGNSRVLPFEKRYFSGGANSVRGWSVRGLGPGSFRGNRGRIDFINQTGDMKLDMSLEYRTFLFWKFNGAVFVDAGNIWTIRNYPDQPGGKFKWDEFYKQIAFAYGLGIRLNFDYFILRFDMGMKAVNPAYTTDRERWPIFHPKFSRDFAFHFAVGMPF